MTIGRHLIRAMQTTADAALTEAIVARTKKGIVRTTILILMRRILKTGS